MRVGEVIGHVTLSRRLENVAGGRFLIVQPQSAAALRGGAVDRALALNESTEAPRAQARAVPGAPDRAGPTSEPLVVYDALGAGHGARVALTEGREAAMPFLPRLVPVDAYCAAVLDAVELVRSEP